MKKLAQLNDHVTFYLIDSMNENIIHFSRGLEAMLNEKSGTPNGKTLSMQFIEDDIEVAIAMTYGPYDTRLSYVDNVRTFSHGTHVLGLYEGVFEVAKKYIENEVKESIDIAINEVIENLNFIIRIKLDSPQFVGAVRQELTNEEVRSAVKKGIIKKLPLMLESDESVTHHFQWPSRDVKYKC